MEPLEYETEADRGAGLGFLLDGCEFDMLERRFIHEGRRVEMCVVISRSAMSWSLGPQLATALLGLCTAVPPLVILRIVRRCERPSWLSRVTIGTRAVGATGTGPPKEGAVVVMAEVCTAVAIDPWPGSRANAVFFLLFECAESKGVFRPKDRPTADAPTTVAVAQSCIMRMRQPR